MTKKIDVKRRISGGKQYEKITRNCLCCGKIFVGFRGVDFMCRLCKLKDHD